MMEPEPTLEPTQPDERVMAGLSHISVLMPVTGVILPLIIWVTQKDKSRFVHFQALQAIAYQYMMVLFYFSCMGCYMFGIFGSAGFSAAIPSMEDTAGIGLMIIPFLVLGLMCLGMLAFIVYGLVGAVTAFQANPSATPSSATWSKNSKKASDRPDPRSIQRLARTLNGCIKEGERNTICLDNFMRILFW
jgi:uncharacterized Tic20 family protein